MPRADDPLPSQSSQTAEVESSGGWFSRFSWLFSWIDKDVVMVFILLLSVIAMSVFTYKMHEANEQLDKWEEKYRELEEKKN